MSYYKSGSWNAICDICGRRFKADKLRKRWDGFMACKHDWEPRHSLDFLRGRAENTSVPWSRSEGSDVFVAVPYALGVAGIAVAGTARPNFPSV